MTRKLIKRHCDFCGQFYIGQGKFFCSVECRQKHRNTVSNPAKTAGVREKISMAMTGNTNCQGRVLSEETKGRISQSLTGKKQTAEVIAKRVDSAKKTAAMYGGITPARKAHMDRLHQSGDKHPNWKGGTSHYRAREYFRDQRYKPFRQSVLARDNWACVECGKRGGKLEVHHVKPYATYPDLAFDIDNGVTLCLSCHNKTKRGQPKPRKAASSVST